MTVLTIEQSREYDRDLLLETMLNENKSVYDKFTPFKTEALLFLDNFSTFKTFIPVKKKKGKGIVVDKNTLKQSIATDASAICTTVTSYANSIANADLALAVRYRSSDITRLKNSEVVGIITSITDAVTPLLEVPGFQPYNITAEMLSSLTNKTAGYDGLVAGAGSADKASSIANGNINDVIKLIRGNIRQLSLLIGYFKDKNPEFCKAYYKAIEVDNSNIHHTGIRGIVTGSNGPAIYQAIITGEGKKKVTKTDKLGAYELVKIKPGLRTFTFVAPGYEPQEMLIQLQRGKILDVNIGLTAKVITMSATA